MEATYLETPGPSAALNEANITPIRVLCLRRMKTYRNSSEGKETAERFPSHLQPPRHGWVCLRHLVARATTHLRDIRTLSIHVSTSPPRTRGTLLSWRRRAVGGRWGGLAASAGTHRKDVFSICSYLDLEASRSSAQRLPGLLGPPAFPYFPLFWGCRCGYIMGRLLGTTWIHALNGISYTPQGLLSHAAPPLGPRRRPPVSLVLPIRGDT